MYLVVNKSKRLITISDLDVTVPAGTMLDLDKYKRNKYLNPRDSTDLQEALRRGMLKVMKNDRPVVKQQATAPTPAPSPDYSEMMKIMKDTIREEMDKNKPEPQPEIQPQIQPQQTIVNHDDSKLIEMMSEIKGLISSGVIRASDMPSSSANFALDDDDIDEDKIKEIHAAAMKKMKDRSNSKSEISYDTNTVKDDTISDNLSDLEGLI